MDAHYVKVVFFDDRLGFVDQLMPNAEAGSGPANICFAGASATAARVEAQADVVTREKLTKFLNLVYRAQVDGDALLDQLFHVVREFLRAEANISSWHTGHDGPCALVAA